MSVPGYSLSATARSTPAPGYALRRPAARTRSGTRAAVEWDEVEPSHEEEAAASDEALERRPWFAAGATRAHAAQLLAAAQPRSFVVRPSSTAGQCALSMSDAQRRVIHAAIQRNAAGHYFIAGAPDPYPTITGLVGSLKLSPVPRSLIQRLLAEPPAKDAPTRSPRSGPTSPREPPTSPRETPSSSQREAASTAGGGARPKLARGGSLRDVLESEAAGETKHSGILTKKGQRRLFVLQNTRLEWFLPDAVTNPDSLAKGRLDLATCSVARAEHNERAFVLRTLDGTAQFELKAETANEVRAWMHVIGKVAGGSGTGNAGGAGGDGGGDGDGGAAAVRKGLLKVRGDKERYFVLLRGHLMWMASPNAPELLGTLPLAGASADRNGRDISVRPASNAPLDLVARDDDEAREWVRTLRDAVMQVDAAVANSAAGRGETYREHEGWLTKKFKRRFCSLRDDLLVWAEDKHGATKGHLTLDGAGVYLADELTGGIYRPAAAGGGGASRWASIGRALGGEKARVGEVAHSFVVNTAFGRSYTFEAKTRVDCEAWVDVLQHNARHATGASGAASAASAAAAAAAGSGADDPSSTAATGSSAMAGWMIKKSKRRWFVLRDDVLYWFESDVHSSGSMRNVKNSADMRGASVRASGTVELTLYTAVGSQYQLRAGDMRTRDDWLAALNASIQHTRVATTQRARDNARVAVKGAVVAERAGWTVKKGKRRWLALRGGSLRWYDGNPNDLKSAAKLKGSLPLAGCICEPIDGHDTMFAVETSSGHRYEFTVQSASDAKQWLEALRAAIEGKSRENELALATAQTHRAEVTALFGIEQAADSMSCVSEPGIFAQRFALLHTLLAVDDSAEVVRATLLGACAQNQHLALLNDCVARELDKSISVGTLFRTNSITTKLVREFLLVSTHQFLRDCLFETVRDVVQNEPELYECDPSKLPAGTKIGERLKRVAVATDRIVTAVDAQLGSLPRDVRAFFLNTYHEVELVFPDHYRTVAAGFLFLRFMVPAVFNPLMFGLVTEKLSDAAQRALILVSKVLQNLANGVEFGKKEAYLEPLNKWLRAKMPAVQLIFDRLTVLDDPADSPAAFDPRLEAGGDVVPHAATLIRRCLARATDIQKRTEEMDSLGALLQLEELCQKKS